MIDHNLIEKYSHSLNPSENIHIWHSYLFFFYNLDRFITLLVPGQTEPSPEKSVAANCQDLTNDQTMPSSTNDRLFAGTHNYLS